MISRYPFRRLDAIQMHFAYLSERSRSHICNVQYFYTR